MQTAISKLRDFFSTGATLPTAARISSLKSLKQEILRRESDISDALAADLGKSAFESYMTEIGIAVTEINYAIKHLPRWVKPRRRRTPITLFPGRSRILYEPFGVALIMSPWNYPFNLTIAPLAACIAAGNCAVIKPSAYSPHSSRILSEIITAALPDTAAVITGGREQNAALLDQKFDFIHFTGSASVGRLVLSKAAANLTPVTLELGGKSPCIIDETADLKLAARRIAFGKCLNAGQTCVAPDYVLLPQRLIPQFSAEYQCQIEEMYGDALSNPAFPRILNEKHFSRLLSLMPESEIIYGGAFDELSLKISPTLLLSSAQSPAMKQEIFGPLLPLIPCESIADAKLFVSRRDKPLALYLFSNDKRAVRDVLHTVSFGGGCINDTIMHIATPHMGFGGVGESGMGKYHGKDGFHTFSHSKSILTRGRMDIRLRYQPSSESSLKLLRKFMK